MKRVQPTIRGNTEGDEVIDMKTRPGAPNHHVASARKGRTARRIVARREDRRTSAAAWFAAGALASCAAFAAILWLWVVPAMDAALAAVHGAVA